MFKNLKFITSVFCAIVLSCSGGGDDPITPVPEPQNTIPTNSGATWADEFNIDGAPDTTKWNYDIGTGCPNLCGWGNNEAQYYTNRADNVIVANGLLKITAKKESYQSSQYTSAKIF